MEAIASYPGMKPMLNFTSFPSRTEPVRPRRRRRKIATPKNPQVKSVHLRQEESVPYKWVSMIEELKTGHFCSIHVNQTQSWPD